MLIFFVILQNRESFDFFPRVSNLQLNRNDCENEKPFEKQ